MAKKNKASKPKEVLAQVRLAADLYAWLEADATRGGETVAGWLRRLIIREYRTCTEVRAWCWVGGAHGVASADYRLEPLREIPDGGRVFALKTATGSRLSNERWMKEPPFQNPEACSFLLQPPAGEPSMWRFVHSIMRTDGVLEVTLTPLRTS